ncbi:MAG TPA: hypothetical protein VHF69_13360 [Candidatus Synoicihabitans sp.]|nr:hypothetical protein [Candidatus Synoicihabitans sp.]
MGASVGVPRLLAWRPTDAAYGGGMQGNRRRPPTDRILALALALVVMVAVGLAYFVFVDGAPAEVNAVERSAESPRQEAENASEEQVAALVLTVGFVALTLVGVRQRRVQRTPWVALF